ncbi:hypothetical protein SAMN04488103_109159 [Gemmobacter aquatilis]|uniref:Uncharacterized protein n=1 Tax=Gemmobacter aquatilis TaxID=933059 RepID=A0A1H8KQT6_9RHOB|nr:hypothetical protein SAMN04488103_109159 [Gemmobacter aquatilis]
MGRRQAFTRAELADAAAVARIEGARITLRRGDIIAVVDPAPTTVASGPDQAGAESALEAWIGGRNEGPA